MVLQKINIKIRGLVCGLQKLINITYDEPIPPRYYYRGGKKDDITSYKSTTDIFKSGRFSAEERRREYRRRGKSPSGVIDGVYNDMYLEDGASYNDMDRDWDADA
jgi:hypothetical protein